MHVISLAGEYSPIMHLLVVSELCIRPGSTPQPSRMCVSSVANDQPLLLLMFHVIKRLTRPNALR